MKKFVYILMAATLIFGCAKEPEKNTTGSIYGVITDKATGEPIKAAGVQLNPTGTKTVTGSEGQYEFTELKAGDYTLQVTKTGYTDLLNYSIKVVAEKTNKGDVQIEKLPASLRVVNDKKQNIDSLNFGSAAADVTRSFSIFNDGPESLEWQITETSEWITGVSKAEGTLKAGATQPIIITIDRDKLAGGENTTTIQVTSDNGSKELVVKAVGEHKTKPTLNTLEANNITSNSATFHGVITATGLPTYTERGFVYATSSMPTIENTIAKKTVAVNSTAEYTANVTGLQMDQRYYVRAYAINSVGVAYSSNEFTFEAMAGLPAVSTQEATNKNIASGLITFNGTIVSVGDPAYTERGFVYATTHNPTVDDNKKIASGSGTGIFSVNATGIIEGHTYYVRAYATNAKGTVYGTEESFDFSAAMPTVETNAATNKNIGAGTATFNGNIISIGDLVYTERGFVYSTTGTPTIDDAKKVASGTGTGIFSVNCTGLTEGNVYHIRAYATNSKGTVYGEKIMLDFNATMPTLSTQAVSNISIGAGTATFNGTILTVGDPTYTERGFVYATTHNPTVDDNKSVASGNGTGAFSINATGIIEGHTYYVRAYATNVKGTVYGAEISFNFVGSLPVLGNYSPSVSNINIANRSATFSNALVSNAGVPSYTERGFVYGTTQNPTIANIKIPVPGSGTDAFSANVTGIDVGLTYYVRSYASNSKGTTYSPQSNFDFNPVMPTFSNYYVTNRNIAEETATFNATIGKVGDPVYTERGFVYGTNKNPEISTGTKIVVSGSGAGVFSSSISGLAKGYLYYVRAYAIGANGTVVYSGEFTADFTYTMPAVTIKGVAQAAKIFLDVIISDAGKPTYNTMGICYSTSPNPTREENLIKAESSVGSSGTAITLPTMTIANSIEIGKTYYVRYYLINEVGIVYSNEYSATIPAYIMLSSIGVQTIDLGGMIYTTAVSTCKSSRVGGHSDWRLPTDAEFEAIRTYYYNFEKIWRNVTMWTTTYQADLGYIVRSFGGPYGDAWWVNSTDVNACLCVRTLP